MSPAGVAVNLRTLIRAHRWRRIESGHAKSITDLTEQEDVTAAFVYRLLPTDLPGAGRHGGDP